MYFDMKMCGKRIQVLRKKRGLTQLQMTFKVNISEDHLKSIELGRRAPSVDLLIEFAELFHVSLDYLILGRTESNSAELMMELDIISTHLDRLKELI
ncbi:MAG: helix-turn-helix transcriptional regulator [Blautia sp.]|uniref:helix-turn-helix domain-containing protein n=1 Tax=Blautia sp. TaxID=1955243 RepID=UPI002A837EE7|nr:helix-turn-helix transcriptional regulator [Blautia sp.]MCI5963063.1 helix-turn-helix domain-containing protein [Clostridia bacterium]MDY4054045.1 helix-turn-helix transcriptional regulator [Blautia sp.]